MMTGITTHVLDTAAGHAAEGVPVRLERRIGDASWNDVGRGETDTDGRLRTLLTTAPEPGTYRLTFDTGAYARSQGGRTFYPEVTIVFEVAPGESHYHVPLLLNPFGYTTYRGT